MNKKTSLLSGLFFTITVLCPCFDNVFNMGDQINKDKNIIQGDLKNADISDNFEIAKNKNGTTTYIYKEQLNSNNPNIHYAHGVDLPEDKEIEYETTSYDYIGLLETEIKILDPKTKEIIDTDYIRSYVVETDEGLTELYVDYHGYIFDQGEIEDEEDHVLIDHSTEEYGGENEGCENGYLPYEMRPETYVPKVAKIGKTIISSKKDAYTKFNLYFIDKMSTFDIFDLYSFFFKELMFSISEFNYFNNYVELQRVNEVGDFIYKDKINSYITDQSFFSSLYWGILKRPISETGCEIISVYNSLFEAGTKPDFATLILLFDLCNADCLGGSFGVLPVDRDALVAELQSLLSSEINLDYYIAVERALNIVKKAVDDFLTNPILVAATGLTSFIIKETIADPFFEVAKTISLGQLEPISKLADFLLSSITSLEEMMRLIYAADYLQFFNVGEWFQLKDNTKKRKRFIVSFWNKYIANLLIPNVFEGIHTIYVTKMTIDDNIVYVTKNNDYIDHFLVSFDNLLSIFDNDKPGNSCQFIWGCVFND